MKINIEKEKLKKALDKCQGLTNQKTSIIITKNILLKTEQDNKISISATDLTAEYYCEIEALVEKEGIICINAKKFFDIVRNYPENIIKIEEKDSQWIEIGEKEIIYNIVGVFPDDFPEINKVFNNDFFEIEGDKFKKLISIGNSIYPETNEGRPFILGININFYNFDEKSCIKMFSTDTRRIVKYDIINENILSDDYNAKSIIIPKKILPDIIKFIDKENIKISFTNDIFIVNQDFEYFSVNLLEGEFPDCNSLVAVNEEDSILIDKSFFSDMLNRISIILDDKQPIAFFNFFENRLTLSSSNPELGEAVENTKIDYNRDKIDIAFNPKFIIDIIKEIEDEHIKFYLKNSKKHCIIKGCDKNDFIASIMPVKI